MLKKMKFLLLLLPAVLHTTCGDFLAAPFQCIWSKDDMSDMELIRPQIINKIKYLEYNSTLGKYTGYTDAGIRTADAGNKDTVRLQGLKAEVETYCKHNVQIYSNNILSKKVEPVVKVNLGKKSEGSHVDNLMCSAYGFYPSLIKITWMRNGKEVEGDVTSTEEMPDGDWYYQIHSHLEYKPESGEKISCVVEHASFPKPMEYKWDPSMPESDKNRIAIGASGLVLGIIISAAGFIYYRKKLSGRILVPT